MENLLIALNFLVLIGFVVVGIFSKVYFPKYLENKAKNLATKEDIGEITTIVENIRKGSAVELEKLSQQHRFEIQKLDQFNNLRMAALDKRLEVHQEAYELVFGMLEALGDREREIEILKKANEFWKTKSLYVSEAVRETIDRAMIATNAHASTFSGSSPVRPEDNRKRISDALRAIEAAVNLPSFANAAEEEEANKALQRTSR